MAIAQKSDLFLKVLSDNKGIIYKVANSYCKDSEDRNDLIQEIIAQLWKSFDNYSEQYKYSTWIYRISLNVAISFYRKQNVRKVVSSPFTEGILNYTDKNETEELEENIGLLQQFVSELRELDKALILLYLEEKSYSEIAEIIGISETNVATKLSRIKTNLKNKFSLIKNK